MITAVEYRKRGETDLFWETKFILEDGVSKEKIEKLFLKEMGKQWDRNPEDYEVINIKVIDRKDI